MEHTVNDLLHCRLQAWTFPAGIEARWLGEVFYSCYRRRRGAVRRSSPPVCMAMRPRRLNCCCS